MYIALTIMFAGIIVGKFMRNKIKFSLSPYILAVICILLALLGMELGFNDSLIHKFKNIGISALIIASFCVLGSCIAASLFEKFVIKEKKDE